MSLRTMFFGESKAKVAIKKDETYVRADEHLRALELKREHMREQLSKALNEIIKGTSES
jgi:hypothetical protein